MDAKNILALITKIILGKLEFKLMFTLRLSMALPMVYGIYLRKFCEKNQILTIFQDSVSRLLLISVWMIAMNKGIFDPLG